MKNIWISKITIFNPNNKTKGEIKLEKNTNLITSESNSQGKSLLFWTISYVLGNSLSPFKNMLRNVGLGENVDNFLVKVDFKDFDTNNSFTFIREWSKDALSFNKEPIKILKNNKLIRTFTPYRKGETFQDMNIQILDFLGLKNIISFIKIKESNEVQVKMPTLTSLFGFFQIKQEDKNNEFKDFDAMDISTNNKYGVEGRLISFLYMTGELSDDDARSYKAEFSKEAEINKKRILKSNYRKLIEVMKEDCFSYKEGIRNSEIPKLTKEINKLELKLKDYLDKEARLLAEQNKYLKFNNEVKKKKDAVEKFLDKVYDEKISYYDILSKTNIDISMNELFNKLFISELDKSKNNLSSINEQIKEKIAEARKEINKIKKEIDNRETKLRIIRKGKKISRDNDISFILMDEIYNDYHKKWSDLNLEIRTYKKEYKEKIDKSKKFFESLKSIQNKKINEVNKLIKDVDGDAYGFDKTKVNQIGYLAINAFPINRDSGYINRGSVSLSYALTKLLFYANSISKMILPLVIDYEGSDEADNTLAIYNKKIIRRIIEVTQSKNQQLLIFKNKKETKDNSIAALSFPDLDNVVYNSVNISVNDEKEQPIIRSFISSPLKEEDISFIDQYVTKKAIN